jgi:hypothetical protein
MNTKRNLRWCCSVIGLLGSLAGLAACKETPQGPPAIPYGQALDVTQAGAVVAFDFRIDKPERYDVVLEVFEKVPKEKGPLPDLTNAHFKVHLQLLAPGGEVLVDREVKKSDGGVTGKSLGRGTEPTELMSFTNFLVRHQPLDAGTYRIRVENVNPIPELNGRLVKVTVENRHHPK